MKIKHSWKGSEQARIRKKEFALEVSNYPHPTPDTLPLAFQALLYRSRTIQTVGLRGGRSLRSKEWGKGKHPQKRKQNSSEENCVMSWSQGSEIIRKGLEALIFQKTAGPLGTHSLSLEDLGVLSEGSGLLLPQM